MYKADDSNSPCEHVFFASNIIDNLKFCQNCGVMKHASGLIDQSEITTLKPKPLKSKCEIDPMEVFQILNTQSISFTSKHGSNNSTHINYSKIRKELLTYMRMIVNKFCFSDQTYHHACLILDIIMTKYDDLGCDVAVVCCLLISGMYKY